MARINSRTIHSSSHLLSNSQVTHGGQPAARIDAEAQLRRSVMSCMLWENEFYEDGKTIADRIMAFAQQVSPATLSIMAVEAREQMKLRHISMLLLVALCKRGSGNSLVARTIARTIQRADELAELLAIYWKINGKDASLSAQLKNGLRMAFEKFDRYQLSKYNRDNDIKLRDVMFLVRPNPSGLERSQLYKELANNTLGAAGTWENRLSAGEDKQEAFEDLLRAGKLGYMALLKNMRNMEQANVDRDLVLNALEARKGGADRVLPFRFIAAAKHAPSYEDAVSNAMLANIDETIPKFDGTTIILVDVSGSMDHPISAKSDLTRMDAAAALAVIFPGRDVRVFTFSHNTVEVPRRRGIPGIKPIISSQSHGGTNLGGAVHHANSIKHDRLIVITDEQAQGAVPAPLVENAYMINVASARNGIGYGHWNHIDGFSENVIRWISEFERGRDTGYESVIPNLKDDAPVETATVGNGPAKKAKSSVKPDRKVKTVVKRTKLSPKIRSKRVR